MKWQRIRTNTLGKWNAIDSGKDTCISLPKFGLVKTQLPWPPSFGDFRAEGTEADSSVRGVLSVCGIIWKKYYRPIIHLSKLSRWDIKCFFAYQNNL